MFKRLSELEPPAYRARSATSMSKPMLELQALILETFAEIKHQDLCDLFVQPTLTIADPHGLVTSVLADLNSEPGEDLQFEMFLALMSGDPEPNRIRSDHVPAHPEPSRPILVLGSVGIGKSTLLRHTFACSLSGSPILPIFVDFKGLNDDVAQIDRFVVDEIDRLLTEHLKSDDDAALAEEIYFFGKPARKIQLENLRKFDSIGAERSKALAIMALQDNKKDWNRARIHYLQRKAATRVCLVFDNVDHHWTPGYVGNAITEAMEQARQNKCRVVMTLRSYNYGVAYERHAYAAEPFTVIRLHTPDLRLALQKRIAATLQKYPRRNFTTFKLSNNMTLAASDYFQLLTKRLEALLSAPVQKLLAGLADSNFRRLLVCTRYIFSTRTLMAPDETLRSGLSEYDALECILRPSGPAYESPEMNSEAVVVNLFEDESPGQPGNNLVRVRVLQAIARYGTRAPHRAILEDLDNLGYSSGRVQPILNLFHNFGLIDHGDNSGLMWSVDPTPYCHQLTYSGRFYLENLIYEYRYAAAVKEATSFPEKHFQKIVGSSIESERRLDERAVEVQAFDEYIAEQEREEEKRCQNRSLLKEPFHRIAERMKSAHQEAVRRLHAARSREATTARESSRQNQQGE